MSSWKFIQMLLTLAVYPGIRTPQLPGGVRGMPAGLYSSLYELVAAPVVSVIPYTEKYIKIKYIKKVKSIRNTFYMDGPKGRKKRGILILGGSSTGKIRM